ncbi:hypothetical protein KKG71_04695, partial [Patescibacteria group bacterium]|nr:hypothetical protein [Patescibacteria group bacterium]
GEYPGSTCQSFTPVNDRFPVDYERTTGIFFGFFSDSLGNPVFRIGEHSNPMNGERVFRLAVSKKEIEYYIKVVAACAPEYDQKSKAAFLDVYFPWLNTLKDDYVFKRLFETLISEDEKVEVIRLMSEMQGFSKKLYAIKNEIIKLQTGVSPLEIAERLRKHLMYYKSFFDFFCVSAEDILNENHAEFFNRICLDIDAII